LPVWSVIVLDISVHAGYSYMFLRVVGVQQSVLGVSAQAIYRLLQSF
jgi:hypothetical protein